MKTPALLLLLTAGLWTATLAGATPAAGASPVVPAITPAATPSWAGTLGCDPKAADSLSLFLPAASATATDMCGPCNLLLCKNVAVNAGCIIGNHRGHCISLGTMCSDNVTWQCDCRLPG